MIVTIILNIGVEEFLGINGMGKYNQQFHGFKAWMDPILKFMRSKIKQLAKQLQYWNFA